MRKLSIIFVLVVFVACPVVFSASCGSGSEDDAVVDSQGPGGGGGGGGDDDDDTGGEEETVIIAVVYKDDAGAPSAYENILSAYGYEIYGVNENSVTEAAFQGADLILVDSKTIWSTASTVTAVMTSGLPVLAMGFGGLSLYKEGGLSSGWNSSGEGTLSQSQDSVQVQNPNHAVFNAPSSISIPANGRLILLSGGVELYAVNVGNPAAGISILATSTWDDQRGAILIENGNYMSWGFDFAAADLNSVGRQLLVNSIVYLTN